MDELSNNENGQNIREMISKPVTKASAYSGIRSGAIKGEFREIRPSMAAGCPPQEHRILHSEARYRDLFKAAQDGIVTLNTQTGTILEVNPYFSELLDYPQSHCEGKSLWEIGLFPDVKASRKAFQNIKAHTKSHYEGVPLRLKDGRIISVELVCNVYGVREEQVIQCLVRDSSVHRRNEEVGQRLLQAQKMEAVGQLAAGMAHDFNNVLQVVLGYSEILQARVDLSEPVRRIIGTIQEAGRSAKSLTHQLLTFSRQEVLQPGLLDLNEAVSRIQALLRGLIGDEINLVSSLGRDLGTFEADPHQIDQVLMNLAINARDAMPKGGTITFETANVLIDDSYVSLQNSLKPGRYVTLIVRDTGIGMDAKTRRQVFEPFFTTKAMNKGTGLGLATVFNIVKQNGGAIAVSSEPDHGTTFTLYFPRRDEAPLAIEAVKPELVRGGTETILLVDDAPSSRMLLRVFLEHHGYTVLDAGHPAEALRIARELTGPLPLMITDVSMPGFSGRELAQRIAAERPETRVIYISGDPDGAVVRHDIQRPGHVFLEKPFTCEELLSKVRQVLDLPPRLLA